MKPIVALIGRPNVGKSTLFNRITRKKDALVDDQPGVTRDRHYGNAVWDERVFALVDTGGFIGGDDDAFAGHIRYQVEQAIDEATAVVLVLDGKGGLSPYDRDLIDRLRQVSQPVLYAVNKIDGPEQEGALSDFYALGLSTLYPVSGEHGYGMGDFLDALVAKLPDYEDQPDGDCIRIALVGRPNVGKSSVANRLLGQDRLVVSDLPGTTRDAVDSAFERDGRNYLLVDTAGIRRKAKVQQKLEKFSIIKALKSLERCDVALIVLDAREGITEQDIKVAGYAYERGCGTIWVVNKWDLMKQQGRTPGQFARQLKEAAKYLAYAPMLSVSALTGQRMNKLMPLINQVYDQYCQRITTGQANRIMNQATQKTEPSLHKGHRLKFYYTTQIAAKPPTFVAFVNYPQAVHFSYERYLLNQIRIATGLDKVPVRLYFRQRKGRLTFKKRKK